MPAVSGRPGDSAESRLTLAGTRPVLAKGTGVEVREKDLPALDGGNALVDADEAAVKEAVDGFLLESEGNVQLAFDLARRPAEAVLGVSDAAERVKESYVGKGQFFGLEELGDAAVELRLWHGAIDSNL